MENVFNWIDLIAAVAVVALPFAAKMLMQWQRAKLDGLTIDGVRESLVLVAGVIEDLDDVLDKDDAKDIKDKISGLASMSNKFVHEEISAAAQTVDVKKPDPVKHKGRWKINSLLKKWR